MGLSALLMLAVAAGPYEPDETSAAAPGGLNVVLIVSDDQTVDSVDKMPWLSSQPDWVWAERGYANQPWCCPSRASLLSGRYAHEHGVIGNSRFARNFDDSKTIATKLDRAGYETGLFGKYLNGFPWQHDDLHVPRGWDNWATFLHRNGAYYDYDLAIDGKRVAHQGTGAKSYSTDLLARTTSRFVADAKEPFFAMYTPYAPHEPAPPAPRHQGEFAGEPVPQPPNFNTVAPDQPRFYRRLSAVNFEGIKSNKRRAWRATLAVDDATRRLVHAVEERGALDRTVFVYLSDNGFSYGSHKYRPKNCLYQECAHVPMAFRMPDGAGGSIETPISNVDVAPTLAKLAGAGKMRPVDGESLAKQLLGDQPWPADRDLLLEVHASKQAVPEGYAIVTKDWKYTKLETGERELYHLQADPYELDNLHDEPAYAAIEADLRQRLRELRGG